MRKICTVTSMCQGTAKHNTSLLVQESVLQTSGNISVIPETNEDNQKESLDVIKETVGR